VTALQRARRALREGGTRALVFGALAETVYRRLLVLERRLLAPAPAIDADGVDVVLLQDADAYRRLRPDTPPQELARRWSAGDLCFAALRDDAVIGATWARMGSSRIAYLDLVLSLDDDEVYLSDSYVLPAMRGRRVAPAIAAAQIRHYRERGARRMIATVLPENRASLRARSRTGYEACGVVGWFALAGRRWPFRREFASPRSLA